MSTPVTLDSIRAAAEAKYASFDIAYAEGKVARLQNAVRLSKEVRDKLAGFGAAMNEEGADQEAILADVLSDLCGGGKTAKEFLAALGGDLGVLMEVFSAYSKATQVGEASASQD